MKQLARHIASIVMHCPCCNNTLDSRSIFWLSANSTLSWNSWLESTIRCPNCITSEDSQWRQKIDTGRAFIFGGNLTKVKHWREIYSKPLTPWMNIEVTSKKTRRVVCTATARQEKIQKIYEVFKDDNSVTTRITNVL